MPAETARRGSDPTPTRPLARTVATRAARPPRPPRVATLALAVLVGLGTVSVLSAVPAAARDAEGTIELVAATTSGTSATVTVRVTDAQGAPATGATVAVGGDDGAGATLAPVRMQTGEVPGQYSTVVDLPSPGTWSLRVTSESPTATLGITQEVTDDPQVTTESVGGSGSAGASTTATVDSGVPELKTTPPTTDEDGGTSPIWWVIGGVAVVVAVGLGIVFVTRGRRPGPID